jgi:hypothetical protein
MLPRPLESRIAPAAKAFGAHGGNAEAVELTARHSVRNKAPVGGEPVCKVAPAGFIVGRIVALQFVDGAFGNAIPAHNNFSQMISVGTAHV